MDPTESTPGPWTFTRGDGPLVAVALHAGRRIRPDLAPILAAPPEALALEEDTLTDRWTRVARCRIVVHASRFGLDLNRPRERCVYAGPDEAWGIPLWRGPVPREVRERSLALHDAFYREADRLLDRLTARHAAVAVLDLHAYNDRRPGGAARNPPDPRYPDVDVCTGSVDLARWGPLVERLAGALAGRQIGGRPLVVGRNARFRGGHFCRWVNRAYRGRAVAIALEARKTYVDPATGRVDPRRFAEIGRAVGAAARAVEELLRSGA